MHQLIKHSFILDQQDDVHYEFHNHKLTLVSSASFQEENEEEDDHDDEKDYSCRKSELICNECITPIIVKQTSSSSSSSSSSCSGSGSSKDNYYYYYMRCSMRLCKYYLHLACFQWPTQISSVPHIHKHDHNFSFSSVTNLNHGIGRIAAFDLNVRMVRILPVQIAIASK